MVVKLNGCVLEDEELLKKYKTIWNKVSTGIK